MHVLKNFSYLIIYVKYSQVWHDSPKLDLSLKLRHSNSPWSKLYEEKHEYKSFKTIKYWCNDTETNSWWAVIIQINSNFSECITSEVAHHAWIRVHRTTEKSLGSEDFFKNDIADSPSCLLTNVIDFEFWNPSIN